MVAAAILAHRVVPSLERRHNPGIDDTFEVSSEKNLEIPGNWLVGSVTDYRTRSNRRV